MFDSLKSWLSSLGAKSQLFDHTDDGAVHVALASVLYHIIKADGLESDKEKRKFSEILMQEFALSSEQSSELYCYVKTLETSLKHDLETINEHLSSNPNLRMDLMKKLNRLSAVDGVDNKELDIFYQAMAVIFPEVNR